MLDYYPLNLYPGEGEGGTGHSVLEWVNMCVRKSECKGTFFGAVCVTQNTQLVCLKWQKCETRYIF